jgi:hypothetical protein
MRFSIKDLYVIRNRGAEVGEELEIYSDLELAVSEAGRLQEASDYVITELEERDNLPRYRSSFEVCPLYEFLQEYASIIEERKYEEGQQAGYNRGYDAAEDAGKSYWRDNLYREG